MPAREDGGVSGENEDRATNRPEVLDPALLRAGRFDRHVSVDRPYKTGRVEIFKVHSRGVMLGPDADLEVIASMIAGFVGADLASIINEGALLAVRRAKDSIGLAELQEAVERIVAALQREPVITCSGTAVARCFSDGTAGPERTADQAIKGLKLSRGLN